VKIREIEKQKNSKKFRKNVSSKKFLKNFIKRTKTGNFPLDLITFLHKKLVKIFLTKDNYRKSKACEAIERSAKTLKSEENSAQKSDSPIGYTRRIHDF